MMFSLTVAGYQIEDRFSIACILLDRGADPNAITMDERGPLLKPPLGEYINAVDDPHLDVILLLLRYGARVVLKVCRQTPFISSLR